MAQAILLHVVGVGQQTLIADQVVPTFGARAMSATNSQFPDAVSKFMAPNPTTGANYTNYWVTQTLEQILAALNETTTEDLSIVGNLTVSGNIDYSTTATATAFAGGGQGSATALTLDNTNVTTVATAGDSVKLPTAVVGYRFTVKNNGVAALAVFPATSGTINGGSANASITLQPNESATFLGTTTTNWETLTEVLSGSTVYTDTLTEKTLNAGITITNQVYFAGTPQTLTGAGAVSLTTYTTLLVTTGANALTLAAGSEGQMKFIRMKTDGGDGTLTVTNLQGGTTLTFNDAGDFVHLFYSDAKWNILTNSGATLA